MEAELADGTILEFPDGTDPQVIQATVKKMMAGNVAPVQEQTKTEPQIEDKGYLASLGAGIGRGVGNVALTAQKGIGHVIPGDIGDWLIKDAAEGQKKLSGEVAPYKAANPLTTGGGQIVGEVATTWPIGGLLGKVVSSISQSPKALAIAEALRTGGMGTQAAGLPTRMLAGGTVGAASDLMTGGEGTTGAAIGSVLPAGQKLLGVGAGKVYDALLGKGKDVRGGKVMRDVAGDKLANIKAALAGQGDDISAAQAAEKAGSTRFSALGNRAERMKSEYFNELEKAQEAKRLASLEAVMPDEIAATAARSAATDPMYAAARNAGNVVNSAPVVTKIDDLLKRNPGNPELVRELTKIKSGLIDEAGNFRANAEQVASVMDGIKASIANKENKFILSNLLDVKDDIAKSIPGYQAAQQKFKAMSPEVNQSKVIQAMIDVMKKSTGGERVTPFLDVMGRGENALLRRADQSARFGGIEDVLTKSQMAARNKVADEMTRDVSLKSLSSKGVEDLADVLKKDAFHTTIPNYISWKLSAAKRGLDIAEEFLNEKTMKRVYEAMKTPQGALDLINTLPAHERTKVLKFVTEMNSPVITPAATVDKGGK